MEFTDLQLLIIAVVTALISAIIKDIRSKKTSIKYIIVDALCLTFLALGISLCVHEYLGWSYVFCIGISAILGQIGCDYVYELGRKILNRKVDEV